MGTPARPRNPQIVVLGGGYASMMATARLARQLPPSTRADPLVSPLRWFVEQLRTSSRPARELRTHRIPDIVAGTPVTFRQAAATAIDHAAADRRAGRPAPR